MLLLVKKLIARLLQRKIVGESIRWFFPKHICFQGVKVLTNHPAVGHATLSALFFGFYESAEVRLLKRFIRDDLPVLELGSSIGVISALAGKRLNRQELYCVEANAALLEVLSAHLALNGISRYSINHYAVSYSPEKYSWFTPGRTNLHGRISKEGNEQVENISLQKLLQKHAIKDFTLLCDIEGAEIDLLLQDPDSLQCCQQLFLEAHPGHCRGQFYSVDGIVQLIKEQGFSLLAQDGHCFAFARK